MRISDWSSDVCSSDLAGEKRVKRLIFCFDGTWNKLLPDVATNVVLTAASIDRIDPEGVPQVIHYDEGVATGDLDEHSGRMFGHGLIGTVREDYRLLVFYLDTRYAIFVFCFLRGAFRSLPFMRFS